MACHGNDRRRRRCRLGASSSANAHAAATSRMTLAACICLILAMAVVVPPTRARATPDSELDPRLAGRKLGARQLATSADADGNSVVFSVGLDEPGLASTTTLETVPAGAPPAATTSATTTDLAAVDPAATTRDAAPDASAPPALPTGTDVTADQGQATAPPNTDSTRPLTYIAYTTIAGQQVAQTATFHPVTALPTSAPQEPLSGTVLGLTEYLPVPTSSVVTGSAGFSRKRVSGRRFAGAAAAAVLGVLLGAILGV